MSEFDVRTQIAESFERVDRRLAKIEKYQTFLMLCVVFWAFTGILSARIEDFAGFMLCILAVGLCSFIVWHIRYGKPPREADRSTEAP